MIAFYGYVHAVPLRIAINFAGQVRVGQVNARKAP
jgi:hypothetical protein